MQKNSFDAKPVPFCPKNAAPIKNMHNLLLESSAVPDAVDVIKLTTFREAVGDKILGAFCAVVIACNLMSLKVVFAVMPFIASCSASLAPT